MTLYYRGPQVVVTHEVFDVWWPCRHRFLIKDLEDVRELHGRRLIRPELELIGTYRGAPVCLFATQDPRVFGQIKRALVRAFEAKEDW
jgi:hypothetical protein